MCEKEQLVLSSSLRIYTAASCVQEETGAQFVCFFDLDDLEETNGMEKMGSVGEIQSKVQQITYEVQFTELFNYFIF